MILRRKCNGAKIGTEATDYNYFRVVIVVGERSISGRRCTVRSTGRYGSENAGMSSEREVRIFPAERLRFPGQGSSSQG